MAHILVADYDSGIPTLLAGVLELEGHWVTCVSDLWQLLSMVRGTLHPMIVIFNHSVPYIRPDEDTHEHPLTIMQRYETDLRRHRWIELCSSPELHLEEARAFYDRLGVQQVGMPFELEPLIELVARLAQELEQAT